MSEEHERPPAGEEQSESVELGEPERESPLAERDEAPPNLDERQERIRTRRKPAGPPHVEPDEAPAPEEELEQGGGETEQQPVDPD